MEKSLKYNFYNQFGVFQLRDIGRQIGVKLPTTLRKDELIKQIILIEEGKLKPIIKTSKQGRPPKNYSKFNASDISEDEIKSLQQQKEIDINENIILFLNDLKQLTLQAYSIIMNFINKQYETINQNRTL